MPAADFSIAQRARGEKTEFACGQHTGLLLRRKGILPQIAAQRKPGRWSASLGATAHDLYPASLAWGLRMPRRVSSKTAILTGLATCASMPALREA